MIKQMPKRPPRGHCNIICPERYRCLDVDSPSNCPLWRMKERARREDAEFVKQWWR